MRAIYFSALLAVFLVPAAQIPAAQTPAGQAPAGQAPAVQSPDAQAAAARYAAADIRVLSPGVVYNAGLLDLAAAFTKETGKKVAVSSDGMGRIVNDVKTATPPADVIMLPLELMSTLALDNGIKGSYTPLGRVEVGLAVRAGAPHPDISTVEKFKTAILGAKAVMYSNPAGGSMVGHIADTLVKRPEFAGVHAVISTRGEGGQALARGEGDMALQLICEILPYKEIELVGPLPRELAAWIDNATAVSARSMHPDDALAFIRYMTRPEAAAVWKAKGLNRF
jgi:molybdate transport system substrate-binding protein